MKKLISIAAIFFAVSVLGQSEPDYLPTNKSMLLAWDLPDSTEMVVKWEVLIWSDPPAPSAELSALVQRVETSINGIELGALFGALPNGWYYLQVVAIDIWGFPSPPSDPFYVVWYARPQKPTGVTVTITPKPPQ